MTNIILHCYNPIHNHYYLDNYNFNKLYKNLDNNGYVDLCYNLKKYIIKFEKFSSYNFYNKEIVYNNKIIRTLRLPTSVDSKLGYFISNLITNNIIKLQNIQN